MAHNPSLCIGMMIFTFIGEDGETAGVRFMADLSSAKVCVVRHSAAYVGFLRRFNFMFEYCLPIACTVGSAHSHERVYVSSERPALS